MNILTKICVVVLTVLVLVASTVFITMATEPQNWRYHYDMKRQESELYAQSVRFEKLHADRLAADLKDTKALLDKISGELAALKAERLADPKDLLVAELKSEIETQTTRLTEQGLVLKAEAERNKQFSAQLDECRKTIDDLALKNRRDLAEITQLRGKLERAERTVQALHRQLRDRDERIQELERVVVAGPAAARREEQPTAGTKLIGSIDLIQGETARINVGAAQGAAKGQKLYIYRSDKLVGYIRIEEVDEDSAAGLLVDLKMPAARGDKVTNDLGRE